MAQVKVKLVEKSLYNAKGTTKDGQEFWFSRRNSSWRDYNIADKKLGDEFEIQTSVSELTGRAYTSRVGSKIMIEILDLENAELRNAVLMKQIASL